MRVDIITPEEIIYSGQQVKSVTCPGIDGEFQLLDKHSDIVSSLKSGKVRIEDYDGKKEQYQISSGLVECSNSIVNILVEK